MILLISSLQTHQKALEAVGVNVGPSEEEPGEGNIL